MALALPQHGEFGFVLFGAAAAAGLLDATPASFLIAVVSVTMALSPLARRLEPFLVAAAAPETVDEDWADAKGRVLVIGFGRFGQIVSQVLFAHECSVTILDNDAARVREAQRFGFRVHFGDGTRRDVLRAAGAGAARMIVVCSDDPATTDRCVALVRQEHPQALLYVRSYDRRHAIRLSGAEVDVSVRETFESGLAMGEQVLVGLGFAADEAGEAVADVRRRDLQRLREQSGAWTGEGDELVVEPEPLLPRA